MVQSPSWEAYWFAASQEIPRISRNPKVHSRTHNRPPPVSILGQPNPVHIPTSHLLEIHRNIHPSTPRSSQWSPSLRFPHQDPIHPISSPIRTICLAHFILLDFITRTIMGEEYKRKIPTYTYVKFPSALQLPLPCFNVNRCTSFFKLPHATPKPSSDLIPTLASLEVHESQTPKLPRR